MTPVRASVIETMIERSMDSFLLSGRAESDPSFVLPFRKYRDGYTVIDITPLSKSYSFNHNNNRRRIFTKKTQPCLTSENQQQIKGLKLTQTTHQGP